MVDFEIGTLKIEEIPTVDSVDETGNTNEVFCETSAEISRLV